MTFYLAALYTHVSCAILSISFFIVRAIWMLNQDVKLQHPLVKVSPHVIDTILLAAAIMLCVLIKQYPIQSDWLTVKFFALVTYIILGTIALKRGKTRRIRSLACAAAILTFAFMLSVAYYHHPLGIGILLL